MTNQRLPNLSRLALILVFVLLEASVLAGCGGDKSKGSEDAWTRKGPGTHGKPETTDQAKARESADEYLDERAFSRKGVIKQLKFENYSKKDAVYAVRHVRVDWSEEAAQAAKAYLEDQGPGSSAWDTSREGVISELKVEGFTHKQAVYAVNKTGQ